MKISVHIPSALRDTSDGAAELRLEAGTVGSVLEQLERGHPALYRCVCDETGAVRQHINLFVNTALVPARDRQVLQAKLKPGDVVSIYQAVSGG